MKEISEEDLSKIIGYARLSGVIQEKIDNNYNQQYKNLLCEYGEKIFDLLEKNNFSIKKILNGLNEFEWIDKNENNNVLN